MKGRRVSSAFYFCMHRQRPTKLFFERLGTSWLYTICHNLIRHFIVIIILIDIIIIIIDIVIIIYYHRPSRMSCDKYLSVLYRTTSEYQLTPTITELSRADAPPCTATKVKSIPFLDHLFILFASLHLSNNSITYCIEVKKCRRTCRVFISL